MRQYYKDNNYVYFYEENNTIAFNENEAGLWEQYQKWLSDDNQVIELLNNNIIGGIE
jgi:hypothetical protein